jgi:hypothetical protein
MDSTRQVESYHLLNAEQSSGRIHFESACEVSHQFLHMLTYISSQGNLQPSSPHNVKGGGEREREMGTGGTADLQ